MAGIRVLESGMDELVVVHAHPDDEALFFYGFLRYLRPRRLKLVCVTADFAGHTAARIAESHRAALELGGERIHLGLADVPDQHLDLRLLMDMLNRLSLSFHAVILTHGPLGEYGHRHHCDVFRAVSTLFPATTWVISGTLRANHRLRLPPDLFAAKREFLGRVYASQQTARRWAAPVERLTHIADPRARTVVDGLRGGLVPSASNAAGTPPALQDFLRRLSAPCEHVPEEIQPIVAHWGLERVRSRLRMRLLEAAESAAPVFGRASG